MVWIFGSPRSGSTWLLRLLTHPLAPADGAELGVERLESPEADPPFAIPINEPYIPQHVAPVAPIEVEGEGELGLSTLPEFRRQTANYFLSDAYAGQWRPHLRRLVLARIGAQARAVERAHRSARGPIVIKEPNGSVGADRVLALLPRSRIVFLLRDGRDVVDSMLDARLPGGWLEGGFAGIPDDLERRRLELVRGESRLWLARTQAVLRAYDAQPPELRRIVRYEDARANPDAELAQLEEWLALERTAQGHRDALRWNDFDAMPADAKGPGKPLRAAQPGLWRENLSDAEQAAMHAIMGEQLAALGYAL